MKSILIFLLLLVGVVMGFLTSIQNGSFIRYLDTHPHPRYVPRIEYAIASTYYMLNDLEDAATYYQRIAQRYPTSPLSDDAHFGYIQSLDETNMHRDQMVALYENYVEKFPQGSHLEVVKKRIDYSKSRH